MERNSSPCRGHDGNKANFSGRTSFDEHAVSSPAQGGLNDGEKIGEAAVFDEVAHEYFWS
jgi:hypothetical protein